MREFHRSKYPFFSRLPSSQGHTQADVAHPQVSAEVSALSLVSVHKRKVVEKSDEAKARIRAAIKHSFLFKGTPEVKFTPPP